MALPLPCSCRHPPNPEKLLSGGRLLPQLSRSLCRGEGCYIGVGWCGHLPSDQPYHPYACLPLIQNFGLAEDPEVLFALTNHNAVLRTLGDRPHSLSDFYDALSYRTASHGQIASFENSRQVRFLFPRELTRPRWDMASTKDRYATTKWRFGGAAQGPRFPHSRRLLVLELQPVRNFLPWNHGEVYDVVPTKLVAFYAFGYTTRIRERRQYVYLKCFMRYLPQIGRSRKKLNG